MRSVFTVDIPKSDGTGQFADNHKILEAVRTFGWEPVEIQLLDDDISKEKKYKEMADILFKDMPEIAVEEKDNVLFYGYLADDQTKFVVTRRVQGQITFRLLHPVLLRVQSSTRKMVRKILDSRFGEISSNNVLIYERGFDDIIFTGRIVPSPLREALKTNRKDALLFIVPLMFAAPLLAGLVNINLEQYELLKGTAERLSTALLTTSVVSGLGLFQTFWEIRRHKLIIWNFSSEEAK